MAPTLTLIDQVKVECDCNTIYEIFKSRTHHISTICPLSVQSVSLDHGEWGTVGSHITWTYFLDGQKRIAKETVEVIDEGKRLITFKVTGGDITDHYTHFTITVQGDTNGEDHFVVWTLTYKKKHDDVPDPTTIMEFCLNVTKDIESHHLN